MPGPKTNEHEGTRAVLKYSRMSPYKAREVLDLIRGKDVALAGDILRFNARDAAIPVAKLLASAVANAQNNDHLDPEELYVSACFADEGTTIKRWRPRARGRATRIRKRTCHVTIIVSRLPDDLLSRLRARRNAEQLSRRARRVAGGRRGAAEQAVARGRRGRRAGEDAPVEETPVEDTEAGLEEASVPDAEEAEAGGAAAVQTEAEPEAGTGAATQTEAEGGTEAEPDAHEAPEEKSD